MRSLRQRPTAKVLLAAALVAPFVAIGVADRSAVARWLSTGVCPGSAMDHPAAPCGAGEFFLRVFLGGWAAFVVVPALVGWWATCVAAFALVRRRSTPRPSVTP